MLNFPHHPHLVALEVLRAAAALTPDLGGQFVAQLARETQPGEKLLRQRKGEKTLDPQLFGLFRQEVHQPPAQPLLLVIRGDGHGADLRHVVPEHVQAAAGDDPAVAVVVDDHRVVADVFEEVLGAAGEHQVLGGKPVHELEQVLHVRYPRLADGKVVLLVPVDHVGVGDLHPFFVRHLFRGWVTVIVRHGVTSFRNSVGYQPHFPVSGFDI